MLFYSPPKKNGKRCASDNDFVRQKLNFSMKYSHKGCDQVVSRPENKSKKFRIDDNAGLEAIDICVVEENMPGTNIAAVWTRV